MKTPTLKSVKIHGAAVLIALSISSAANNPAKAEQCSDTIIKVSEALATTALATQDVEKINAAMESAMAKQKAGDEAGCANDLVEPKAMLELN